MKAKIFKDSDDTNLYLKVRYWDEPEEIWFDIWRCGEPISPTVGLKRRDVKRLINFLEKLLKG